MRSFSSSLPINPASADHLTSEAPPPLVSRRVCQFPLHSQLGQVDPTGGIPRHQQLPADPITE